ncbi:MAG: hypothetical protein WD825_10655 [Gemmatimonadaceae bacterium]
MRLSPIASAALIALTACGEIPVQPPPAAPLVRIDAAPRHLVSTTGVEMIDLTPFIGGFGSRATAVGVNDRNEIVGSIQIDFASSAVVWRDGVMMHLDDAGAENSLASAINERGDISGWSYTLNDWRGLLWVGDVRNVLADDGGMGNYTHGLNDSRTVVGTSIWHPDGSVHPLPPPMTFAQSINNNGWIRGHLSGLGGDVLVWNGVEVINIGRGSYSNGGKDINDDGVVIGLGVTQGYKWKDGVFTYLPGLNGSEFSYAESINRLGDVAGHGGGGAAVWWNDGTTTDLGVLPGTTFSTAIDLNNNGWIVGISGDGGGGPDHAVLWKVPRPPATPPTPAAMLADLRDRVAEIGVKAKPLHAKLDAAAMHLRQGRSVPAANELRAFINQLEAIVRRGDLSAADAAPLSARARDIIARL